MYTAICTCASGDTTGDVFNALAVALEHAPDHGIGCGIFACAISISFVIVSGALIAGNAKGPSWRWPTVLNVAGIFATALFFCLDIRGGGLYRRFSHQLMILEPLVWDRAGRGLDSAAQPWQ